MILKSIILLNLAVYCFANDVRCSVGWPRLGPIEEVPRGIKTGVASRRSFSNLSLSKILKCAKKSPTTEGQQVRARQRHQKVELTLMSDRPPVEFELLFFDESLSGPTVGMVGQGFSGRQIESAKRTVASQGGELNIVVRPGITIGSGSVGNTLYRFIEVEKNGLKLVTETDLRDMPSDSAPINWQFDAGVTGERERNLRSQYQDSFMQSIDPEDFAARKTAVQSRRQLDNAISYIDVMVPYTMRTFCHITTGESVMECPINNDALRIMEAYVELAIFESNQALVNSGINRKRIRLTNTFLADEQYDELVGDATMETTLRQLAKPDGVLDDVRSKREEFGADVVVLMIDNFDKCGLSYKGHPVVDPDWMYVVVYWECATGYYSFIHEMMHLLGASHDHLYEEDPSTCYPPFTEGKNPTDQKLCCIIDAATDYENCFAFGYNNPDNLWRTIMSYNCPNEEGCPRLQMFSQPQIPFVTTVAETGENLIFPVGDEFHDNARQIVSMWDIVSGYRESTLSSDSQPPSPVGVLRQTISPSPSTRQQTPTTTTLPPLPSTVTVSTPSAQPSSQPSSSPSGTPSASPSGTPSDSPSSTPSGTPSTSPSASAPVSPSASIPA